MHEKNFVGHIQLKQCRGELRETKWNITITKKLNYKKIFFFFKKKLVLKRKLLLFFQVVALIQNTEQKSMISFF